jgi:hypothetical protein
MNGSRFWPVGGKREAETLERIRKYCDNGLRYYTWALRKMPSIPEEAGEVGHVESLRSGLAHVLAYLEGAVDERRAMLAREAILTRYSRLVEDEGWEPPFKAGPSSPTRT